MSMGLCLGAPLLIFRKAETTAKDQPARSGCYFPGCVPQILSNANWNTQAGHWLTSHADVHTRSSRNHSSLTNVGRERLRGRLDIGLHNIWSRRRYLSVQSVQVKAAKNTTCQVRVKHINSSTSDGTKRSFVQWFVVTGVNNIKHRSFNTTVNIKHVVNFGSISSLNIRMGGHFHNMSNLWGPVSKNQDEVGGRFENLLSFLKMAGPPHGEERTSP